MTFGKNFRPQNARVPKSGKCLCTLLISLAFVAAGCATTGGGGAPDPKANAERLFKEAEGELAKGQREKAVALLNHAAKESPANMEPWLKMANIWFEAGNYPSSILAANEVLQRDPGNQEAKSLLVVGGLRVAAGAVTGLRSSHASSGARAEAEGLTNALRNVLGEKELVPGAALETKPVATPARPKFRPASSSVGKTPASVAGQSGSGTGASNPFKSLK